MQLPDEIDFLNDVENVTDVTLQKDAENSNSPAMCTNRGMIQRSRRRMRKKLKNLDSLKTTSAGLIKKKSRTH